MLEIIARPEALDNNAEQVLAGDNNVLYVLPVLLDPFGQDARVDRASLA